MKENRNYIGHWSKVKAESKRNNTPMYLIAKLMLNRLYGKFGTNTNRRIERR